MIAKEMRLNTLMASLDEKFTIPIFQRKYSWTDTECNKLWNDIITLSLRDNDYGHFIGSIVCFQTKLLNLPGEIKDKIVIDGQQRLTTLSLMMVAMLRVFEEKGEKYYKQSNYIRKTFLINEEFEGEDRYKLVPTYEDKETFFALITNTEHELKCVSKPMLENFEIFYDRFKGMNIEELNGVYGGINKLDIVYVLLSKEQDNPQLIFESMNSTGRGLTQGDLLRNYLLLDLDANKQKELYELYWKPIESDFGREGYSERFDYFIRDYLMMKTKTIIRLDAVYAKFKSMYEDDVELSKEVMVKSLRTYAKYYTNIAMCKDVDDDLNKLWKELKTLRVDVANVFLIQIYDDYMTQCISKEEFIEIVQIVINYVYRRYICGIPTNSLNKTFLTLHNYIIKDDYVMSVKAALISLETYKRYPSDEEFIAAFATRDMYNTMLKNYSLEKLENDEHLNGIIIDGTDISIEHILPKGEALNEYWVSMLGESYSELQKQNVHRIGNLTITKGVYNSIMSNKSFKEKLSVEGGIRDSHYRLSNDIVCCNDWGIQQIDERSYRLANKAVSIWSYPVVDKEVVNKYILRKQQAKKEYMDMSHYPTMNSDIHKIFTMLDQMIKEIDVNVDAVFNKYYIAYKIDYINFAEIVINQKSIKLLLDMPHHLLDDALQLSENISDIGRFGTGTTRITITGSSDVTYLISLVKQAYNYVVEGE